MKLSQPIGNGLYAPLIIRVALGSYFILAGRMKIDGLPAFVEVVRKYNVLPDHLATLYATLLPFLGIWTTLAAMLTSLMLTSFVFALGIFSHQPFNKDIVLLAASLSLLYSGSGSLSVDLFRKSG